MHFDIMRQKVLMVEQAFLLTKSIRILSEATLNILLDKILNQLLLKLICLEKRLCSVAPSINILMYR